MRVNWDPSIQLAAKTDSVAQKSQSTSQKALQEAAQQFEGLFLNMLLAEMRKTVPESDLLGNRQAEKLFQSLLDQEIADHTSQSQSVGLAKLIYDQMSKYVPEDD